MNATARCWRSTSSASASAPSARGPIGAPAPSGPGYSDYDLQGYVNTDARWLGEGWKNCEYYFGPLYQYQPLAKPGEQPKRSMLTVEPQMTEAACDDLEDRIAEVGAVVAQYTGTGAHADDMDAPRQLYTWGNNLRYLQAARRYCPEMAAKVAPELIKAVNGSTVRVQREFIMNPFMNMPPPTQKAAPAARPLPKGFEAGCSLGPTGGECTFTNTTRKPLSACVTVRVHSKADNADIESSPICSGKVAARSSSKAIKLAFPGKITLQQLCMGTREDDDGREIHEWLDDDCSSEVSAVP